MLALHGLGGSGRYWLGLEAAIADRFTVVAPDHGGFGHSDKPPEAKYDRDFHMANLDTIADEIGAERIIVVGHSLGGIMGALWAARHPHRVAALALVATPFPATDRRIPERDERTRLRDQRCRRQALYAALQLAWPIISFPVRSRTFPRPVIADFMRHTLTSYWATARALLWNSETEEALSGLASLPDVPALILSGRNDHNVPSSDAERWARLLPRAQQMESEGGHQLLLRTHFRPLVQWLDGLGMRDQEYELTPQPLSRRR